MTVRAIDADHEERRSLDEPAVVRFTPSGNPLALLWHGTIWQVVGEPVPQLVSTPSTKRPGPTRARAAVGATSSAWRFTAQTGPASPVLEFGIAFDARRAEWRLVSVGGTAA